ncbi:MAG: hypothetical protein O7G30_16430 [Proteobacteria bacterium]|nr:hypothetical protein [Pseudomonadota bacterium]
MAPDLLRPPSGLSGAAGNPITVRASNDGGVLFDGQGAATPVRLSQNDHWRLEGFDAANGVASVVVIGGHGNPGAGIRDVEVRRVVAWDASLLTTYNAKIFTVNDARDIVLEDVAGFGSARKVFEVYRSQSVTIRRAWARWEGFQATLEERKLAFSCTYRSYNVICENLIAEVGDGLSPGWKVGSAIGMDPLNEDDTWAPREPFDANLRVLGSLAMVPAGLAQPPGSAVHFGGAKGITLTDVVSVVDDPGVVPFNLIPCEPPCEIPEGEAADLSLEYGTALSDKPSVITTQWTVSGFETGAAQATPDVYSVDDTAQLCKRYQDGVLTAAPLWPWPMNRRIASATAYARGEAHDVTAEVYARFGEPPSECVEPTPPRAVRSSCGLGPVAVAVIGLLLALRVRRPDRLSLEPRKRRSLDERHLAQER